MLSKKNVLFKNMQPAVVLTTILSVVHPVFRPVDGIVTFVLSVVGTAVRSITDTVPTLFTKVLLVIDTISGVVDGIMPSLDASADSGGQDDRYRRLLLGILRDAR